MAQSEQPSLGEECAIHIETQLLKHYPELAKFAKTEPAAVGSSSRSTRAQPFTPMGHMEPIAEEKSELAMDIAQAVVEKLDIDRKLDERMKELMLRGDRIFRDIQTKQEQSTEALCRSVSMCLESQRTFQEEHQRLLAAVKDLATMVIPYTPLGNQALEAQSRANAILEETEALKKQMEDHNRLADACAAAAAIVRSPTPSILPPTPVLTPHTSNSGGSGTFSITLRKADDVSLGLNVNADESEEALIVSSVRPGGAVDSWNRQCFGDATGERVVIPGDRIVKVNGIQGDVNKMLEACTTQRLVKLVITHGPSLSTQTGAAAVAQQPAEQTPTKAESSAFEEAAELTPPALVKLRKRAPEFVPSGADATPLQQTQHLAAPPGLFFPRFEDFQKPSSGALSDDDIVSKMDARDLVAGVVARGLGEEFGMQDLVCADGEDSDKEN